MPIEFQGITCPKLPKDVIRRIEKDTRAKKELIMKLYYLNRKILMKMKKTITIMYTKCVYNTN